MTDLAFHVRKLILYRSSMINAKMDMGLIFNYKFLVTTRRNERKFNLCKSSQNKLHRTT